MSISNAYAAKIILENNIIQEAGSGDYKGQTSSNSVSSLDASPYLRNNYKRTSQKELDTPKPAENENENAGSNFKDKDGKTIDDAFGHTGKIEESIIGSKIKTFIYENIIMNQPELLAQPIQPIQQLQSGQPGYTQQFTDNLNTSLSQPEILEPEAIPPVLPAQEPEVLSTFNDAPAGVSPEASESDNINTNTIDPSVLDNDTISDNQLTGPQFYAPDNNYLNPSDQEDDFETSPYAIVNKMLNNSSLDSSPEQYPDVGDSLAIKSSVNETPSCGCGCPIMENIINLARR